MTYGNLLIIRSQRPGKSRRRIAMDQDEIRFFHFHDRLQPLQGTGRNIIQCLPLAHDVQIIIGTDLE